MKYLIIVAMFLSFACGRITIEPPDLALGKYQLLGTIDYDTCASQESELILDFGIWTIASTDDEYFFFAPGRVFHSDDGSHFVTSESWRGFLCAEEVEELKADFTYSEEGLEGIISLTYIAFSCMTGDEDSPYEDRECKLIWSVTGKRLPGLEDRK